MTDPGGPIISLAGKSIIITGAGHGLGRAYAVACADAGASVTCADLDGTAASAVAQGIIDAGGQAIGVRADVTDYAALVAMAEQAATAFGRIDGLVNNAGVMGVVPMSRVPFDAVGDDEWDLVFDTNVKGTWYACRAVVPHLRRIGGGSIVNVSSLTFFIGSPTRIHYVASKGAIIGFTRTLSREVGPDRIRVNTLAPGSVLSEEHPNPEVIAMRRGFAESQAIRHPLEPADIAGTVVFLLSDASRYVTGQTVLVDAGKANH